MIFIVNGDSEDSPNYSKRISCAIDYFCTFDLDALYIARNAPGRRINDALQKRVIPLSKDLAKVILPYEQFGLHYDGNSDTIDEDMEKTNYEKGNV